MATVNIDPLRSGFQRVIVGKLCVLFGIKNLSFVAVLGKYFDEISQDSGRYCFGVQETLKALEMGAVEILIVWENMEVIRYVLKNNATTGKACHVLNVLENSATTGKACHALNVL